MSDNVDPRSDYADYIMYEARMESDLDRFEYWAKEAEKIGKKEWYGEGYRVYVDGCGEGFALTRRQARSIANFWKKERPTSKIEIREDIL